MYRFILPILFLFSFNSNAGGDFCNNCSTSDMENKARSLGSGEHIIVDLNREVMKKFLVIIDNNSFGTPVNFVEELTPSASERSDFNTALNSKSAAETAIRNVNLSNQTSIQSPWELSGNSSKQNEIANLIRGQQSIADNLFNYMSLITSLVGKIANINLTLEFKFSDGSIAVYAITGVASDGTLQLSLVSAVDKDGNNVPLVLRNFVGTYNITGAAALSHIEGATNAWGGHFFLDDTSGGDSNGVLTTECVETSEGRYRCTATID